MANELAISLPFSIDQYGKVSSTNSQEKIWADRVLSVIGTTVRERVMRPDFGTVIPFAMFDDIDTAQFEIRTEIETAFSQQLPLLSLTKTDVFYDSYTNAISITLVYDLPNNQKVTSKVALTTNVGNISISGISPAYEELA